MVASITELMSVVRANPFIDGIGYFVEVTTTQEMAPEDVSRTVEHMRADFCEHCEVTMEGEKVLGLDLHEHIFTSGPDGQYFLAALENLLKEIERDHGIDHICVEFQFDFARAKKAQSQVDELLQP
jgi:hypothetical protein